MPGADDLRRWLHPIGLEELADTLAANDIDLDLLPELSDEDLKELGLSLGHRRRLLRAIGEMPSARPAPAVSTTTPASDSGLAADSTARDAERRQVTVLFCDLVGSTELSGRYDPEDLRELLRRYHDAMTEAVVRHGGYVANYLGDGILAYFGWPRAEEDEAAQAVRAGLAAVAAAKELALHAHVGIASGTVVVGDLEAAGRRQVGAIAGETPNLAARLEALAGADQVVVIGGLTRQLVGAAFVLDDLGPQELKGIAEPVRVWQVLAESSVESRFDLRAGRLTRFIGREHEVALLLDRFERAAAGEGQVVLLCGEAAIGKSRIIRQLHERLSRIPHTRLRFQCSPSHTENALYPVIRHLEHAAGFQAGDEPETRLDKLEALLRQGVEDAAEGAALLAPLLSLPAERYGTIELTAEQRSERVFKALIDQLLGLAAKKPGAVHPRGRPLGRSDDARAGNPDIGQDRGCPGADHDHASPGIPVRLGAPSPGHRADSEPAQPGARRRGGAGGGWRSAVGRVRHADPAPRRWRAAVHRRADEIRHRNRHRRRR
jgi:class 3 adenylate cyclase